MIQRYSVGTAVGRRDRWEVISCLTVYPAQCYTLCQAQGQCGIRARVVVHHLQYVHPSLQQYHPDTMEVWEGRGVTPFLSSMITRNSHYTSSSGQG